MRYLLDTNAVIQLLRGDAVVIDHIRRHRPTDMAISTIVHHELVFGAFKGQRVERNLERLDALPFEIVPFERQDAAVAGRIRADLAKSGTTIAPIDTLIAGQAVARNLAIVTHNLREFSRVPGLALEDWQAPSR